MKSSLLLSCMILGSMALPAPPAGQPAQPAPFDPSRVTVQKAMNFATVNDMVAWKNYLFKHPVCDGHRTHVKQATREDCARGNQKVASVGFQYDVKEYAAPNLRGRLQQGQAPCLSPLSKDPGHKDMPKTAIGTCYTVNVRCDSHLTRVRPTNSESESVLNGQLPPPTMEQFLRHYRDHYKKNPDLPGTQSTKHLCVDKNKVETVIMGFTYQGRCRSPYERDILPEAVGICHQRTGQEVLQDLSRLAAEPNQGAGKNPAPPQHRASANAALSNLLN